MCKQGMTSLKNNIGSLFKSALAKTDVFKSFPASLLLFPLDFLTDKKFSCPCNSSEKKNCLTVFVFVAPALFSFALTFIYLCLKPKREEGKEEVNRNDDEEKDKIKENKKKNKYLKYCGYIAISLIPLVLWIILMLLDGDYVACIETQWKGQYTFDDKLQIKWCKPLDFIPEKNETEYKNLTLGYIEKSQKSGYICLISFSLILAVIVGVYKCCEDKKPTEKAVRSQAEEAATALNQEDQV
nr:uncharacterized protein si:dkeyp-122a9.1 [Danio rerio]|eukprot:XP_005161753.1 uncharacterized protein si:dkeyp-122a9.1 [Danio rerio]